MARMQDITNIENKVSPFLKHMTLEQAIYIHNSGLAIEANDGRHVKFKKDAIMKIKQITKGEAYTLVASKDIIGDYEPWGLFYYITKDSSNNTLYVGMDNSDGHCWVEEFYSIGSCMAWLRGEGIEDENKIEPMEFIGRQWCGNEGCDCELLLWYKYCPECGIEINRGQ